MRLRAGNWNERALLETAAGVAASDSPSGIWFARRLADGRG